jgi:hypothetical protein
MSKTSGGMGKIEDSRNEITTNAGNAYGVPAQCNVQAYIFRIGFECGAGFSKGLFCPFNSTDTRPTRNLRIRFRNAKINTAPTATRAKATTTLPEITPLHPKTPSRTKTPKANAATNLKESLSSPMGDPSFITLHTPDSKEPRQASKTFLISNSKMTRHGHTRFPIVSTEGHLDAFRMQKHTLLTCAFGKGPVFLKIPVRPIPHNRQISLRALNSQLVRSPRLRFQLQ